MTSAISLYLVESRVLRIPRSLTPFLRHHAHGLSLFDIASEWRRLLFLYAGTSFLVLNIVGQLIVLFPEQRLTRAIVLLALGTLITGSMIWFNIQRAAILQRIRIFRADLAMWA